MPSAWRASCAAIASRSWIFPPEALHKEGFTDEEIKKGLQIFGPKGCAQCVDGYKGRVGIYQVMPVSEEIGRIIMEGGNALDITDQAESEGVWDLRKAGLKKSQGRPDEPR